MNRADTLALILDGQTLQVPAGITVAAALAQRPPGCSRVSVSGEKRAPFCGMGICHECSVLINGRRQLACQTLCANDMRVDTGTEAAT
ncbi:MAG: (2Fe-2S)-binding protein [Burkholderiaceae bacterium]|nr:(2Fe-2S)-binding protein [Roseateles sp.]MBV8469243.1 (2Fe-2S)-binding protein [Burkholderiaceae bacterium]